MPIYEYKCESCDHKFELLQSFNAEKTQTCPECGKDARRLLSLGSFVLKGGGWYATENRPKPCQDKKPVSDVPSTCTPSKCDSCPAAN